jgi:hypothetical protein
MHVGPVSQKWVPLLRPNRRECSFSEPRLATTSCSVHVMQGSFKGLLTDDAATFHDDPHSRFPRQLSLWEWSRSDSVVSGNLVPDVCREWHVRTIAQRPMILPSRPRCWDCRAGLTLTAASDIGRCIVCIKTSGDDMEQELVTPFAAYRAV